MRARHLLGIALLLVLVSIPVLAGSGPGWLPFSRSSGGGGGGLTQGAADVRYLMLDASNDPVTGALALDSGAIGTQLLVRGNGADAACSPAAAFNPSIKFSGSAHGMGIAQGLASGPDELALCNDGARMSIGANSAEFSFANGIKPDGDDVRPFGTTGRRWIVNASQVNSLRDGTNLAPAISWLTSPMTGFATPTTHSLAAFSQGVTIWEGGGGVFNLSASLRSAGTSTAAAPEWSYQADQDTGIFRAAADTIAVATGGTQRAAVSTTSITTTLPLLGPAGTAAAPSVSYSGDTDTGMYHVAADMWAVSTGGTLAAYWDPTYAVVARHLVPDGDETRDLGVNGYSWDQLRVRSISRGNPGGGDELSLDDIVVMREQTTSAAPDWFQLPRHLAADVTTNRPACSTSAHAGRLLYIDDTSDAVVAGVCVCGANAANVYGWRSISNFGVNCHL